MKSERERSQVVDGKEVKDAWRLHDGMQSLCWCKLMNILAALHDACMHTW